MKILQTMRTQGRPLTLRQVAALSGLPVVELQPVMEGLRALRLVSRLNTIIESYIIASPAASDSVTADALKQVSVPPTRR